MIISLVAAMAENRAIGIGGGLPWHMPADLAQFKRLTMGSHLLVGRKTYQSIGRPLPGRQMIVLTRDSEFQAPGCQITASLEEGLKLARQAGEKELFVIGGAEIYRQTLALADHLYLTTIHCSPEGDAYFPPFNPQEWTLICSQSFPADANNPHSFTLQHFKRP